MKRKSIWSPTVERVLASRVKDAIESGELRAVPRPISVPCLPDIALPDPPGPPPDPCPGCTGPVIRLHPASPPGEKRCAVCCRVLASVKRCRR